MYDDTKEKLEVFNPDKNRDRKALEEMKAMENGVTGRNVG